MDRRDDGRATASSGAEAVRPRRRLSLALLVAASLLLIETIAAGLLPLVVPETAYLWLYLGPEARDRMKKIAANHLAHIRWDEVTGWSNRPNVSGRKWQTDERGARTTHSIEADRGAKRRVMFLGNSMMNGMTNLTNDETISAYVEDECTESANFAVLLYSLDQVFLAYRDRLSGFQADVVVVGISDDLDRGLDNRFLPFQLKEQVLSPFFKPRFELRAGRLELLPVPDRAAYEAVLQDDALLRDLARTDAYYDEFAAYRRFGLLPVSGTILQEWNAFQKTRLALRPPGKTSPLFDALLRALSDEAASRGARVVLMFLPQRSTVDPGLVRRSVQDRYGLVVTDLAAQGYSILDGRRVLLESGRPLGALYQADGFHYTAGGNRILAEALKEKIGSCP